MGSNSQSRKWALVINNPSEAGLDHSAIKEILQRFSPAYYCMADETASTGTYHTHLFFYAPSPVRFATIKNRFPVAHIEKSYGTVQENRAYHEVEALARILLPEIQAFFESEEGQREFAEWKAQQEQNKVKQD